MTSLGSALTHLDVEECNREYTGETPVLPILMVCMPWESVYRPSLALPVLKECLRNAGFNSTVAYLNIAFANQIGLELYESFATRTSSPHTEWFFAYALFGEGGTGEVDNSWKIIQNSALGKSLFRAASLGGGGSNDPASTCQRIAEQEVPRFIDSCVKAHDWSTLRAVCFTTTYAQSLGSLLLAKRIKEISPSTATIFGGASVDDEMGVEFLRAFDWVDYVVHGEAEESFPALLHALDGGTSHLPPGVSARIGQTVHEGYKNAKPLANLSVSPTPDYDDYFAEVDRLGLRKKNVPFRLFFESSRGCWWGSKHRCSFCGLNGSTIEYRTKPFATVLSDILTLSQKYNCLKLAATDNIMPLRYLDELVPALKEANHDLRIFYEVKANLTRNQVRCLAEAGVRDIQPGIESVNSRVLGLMHKGVTAIRNIYLLKLCCEYGVNPYWNCLYGFPDEVPEDYEHLAHTFVLLSHLKPPQDLSHIMYERFSHYLDNEEALGLDLQPSIVYSKIYPEMRVNIRKIAYLFELTSEERSSAMDSYLSSARSALEQWKAGFAARSINCFYQKGPGFIIINDDRPRGVGAKPAQRRITLKGHAAVIYQFCDDIRSLTDICKMVSRAITTDMHKDQIRNVLESFVSEGLMIREGEQYLSLAVRQPAFWA